MRRTVLPVAAGLLLLQGACGDATGVQPADIAGTWTATAFAFISVSQGPLDPEVTVDLIDLGATATLEVAADGTAVVTVSQQGSTDSDSGTIAVTGNGVTLEFQGDISTGTITRDGDVLTIVLTTGVEFDFNDDGADDPATFRGVFVRS